MPKPVDILMVSPGTTAGWRDADGAIERALKDLGVTVALERPSFAVARHLRRGVLATDLAEAAAARHATKLALRRWNPKATIFSTVQAAMLQPAGRMRNAAIRFDAPPWLNRSGPGSGLLHSLGRRAVQRASLLLPYGLEVDPDLDLPPDVPAVALPVPIAPLENSPQRDPVAVAYAGNPAKKGLDTIVAAWIASRPTQQRLSVTGIDPGRAKAFLHERGIATPDSIDWLGVLSRADYLELLSRAQCFLSASRYEDFGQAQLEALAAGAMLVTTPSPGPYAALPIARALAPQLIAADGDSGALASALDAAFATDASVGNAYRERAMAATAAHSAGELRERIRGFVLPELEIQQ